jgi:hypothetical protein
VREFRCDLRRISFLLSTALSSLLSVAGAAIVATTLAPGVSGCASNCATNCPAIVFDVFATPGENLNLASAQLTGPACPLDQPNACSGDSTGANPCVRLSILAPQAGTCQLDLTFTDGRAPFSVTAEFGPETHQGCCRGFPVVGAPSVTVPSLHPVVIDAGTDAANAADAGRDTDAGAPATDAADAPATYPDAGSVADSGNDGA